MRRAYPKFINFFGLKIQFRFSLVLYIFFIIFCLPNFLLSSKYQAVAVYTKVPPKIDGKVDKEWLDSEPRDGFIQREPLEGHPASNDTKFYILYDDNNIYLLFIMLDKDPMSIPARLVDRDYQFYPDDSINFYLDTYNDQRKAFYFSTNPLGIEQDGLISENGDNVDLTWDAIFKVAARKNQYGWIAEFQIPFTSLRFNDHLREQIWGFNAWRIRKQTREISYWSLVDQNYQMIRLDKGGVIVGLHRLSGGHHLDLLPYITTRNIKHKIESDGTEFKPGLDLKYGLTSDLTFNLTLNPDFGQVEIDEEQINLDKRYEIQLEEKRPFFLENTNLFQTPFYQLFYSRRIGAISDIKGGAKLTGKIGPYTVGLLGAATGDWHNFGLGSTKDSITDELFSVIRIQRDILSSSNVGFMYVDRAADIRSNYPTYSRAAGVDWSIFSGQKYFTGQAVYSYNSEGNLKDGSGYLRAGHYGSLLFLDLFGTYVAPDFNIDNTGYFPKIPGKGTKQAGFHLEAHPFINKKWVRTWGLSIQPTFIRDSDETETGWGIRSTAWLEASDQSRLKIGFTRYRDVEIDLFNYLFRSRQGDELVYWGRDIFAEIKTDVGKPVSLYLRWNDDSQYYFQTHTVGFNQGIEGALKLKPLSSAHIEFSYQRRFFLDADHKKMPKEKIGQPDVNILAVRARYLFSKNIFLRGFFQYTNGAEELIPGSIFGLFEYNVWSRLSGNFLIGWRFRPGSTLYFAYTEEWDKRSTKDYRTGNRIFFLKISYLWSL